MENETMYCKDCMFFQNFHIGLKGAIRGVCGKAERSHNERSGRTKCCTKFELKHCKDCAYYQQLPKGPKGGEYGSCMNPKYATSKKSGFTKGCNGFKKDEAAAAEPQFIEPKGFSEPATVEIIWYLEAKKKEITGLINGGSPLATKAKLRANIGLLDEIIGWINSMDKEAGDNGGIQQ